MKRLIVLLLLSLTVVFVSCEKDVVIPTQSKVVGIEASFEGDIWVGDLLVNHLKGFKANKIYEDSTKEEFVVTESMVSGFDTSKAGIVDVIISYMGYEKVVKVEVLNRVKLIDIGVKLNPNIEYFEGQVIEHYFEAIEIIGNYSDGSSMTLNNLSEYFEVMVVSNAQGSYLELNITIEGMKKSVKIDNSIVKKPMQVSFDLTNNIDEIMDKAKLPKSMEMQFDYLVSSATITNEYMKKLLIQDGIGSKVVRDVSIEEFIFDLSDLGQVTYKMKGLSYYPRATSLTMSDGSFREEIAQGEMSSTYLVEYLGTSPYIILEESNNLRPYRIKSTAFEGKKFTHIVLKGTVEEVEAGAFVESYDTIEKIKIHSSLATGMWEVDLFGGKLDASVEVDVY